LRAPLRIGCTRVSRLSVGTMRRSHVKRVRSAVEAAHAARICCAQIGRARSRAHREKRAAATRAQQACC
jgi:hypothetical protein